ncbi:hypothetical protein NYO91_18100 [Arhodomonas aquaeolei]|uniref:hypothetical protein n=1 Tax=Arhodomonas aquaeolei TaxID=2369 RepID=UPI002169B2BC|nr:hypothetical protein [Arhodomonas aquaeolei]MCS4505996.1 hypothetical protein [Arhodomonas aquaeolei]
MPESEVKSWFIAATVFSAVLAFIMSVIEGRKKYGDRYMGVMLSNWGKVFITLLPFVIYVGISFYSSGWQKIFQGPEVAMGAFLILLFSCQELGCALAVERKFPAIRYRVAIVSMWCLLWLCLALTTVILVFIADSITTAAVFWQFVLLAVAIPTYFCSAGVIKAVEAGHVPGYRRSNYSREEDA